jgi:uncharacterized alpha-E superfamily protein
MSRYMERSDGILRMLKINYASSQDDIHEFSWRPVLKIFTYLEAEKRDAICEDTRAVLKYVVLDKENPNSVFNIVTQARENARSVQDHITKELWQCINDFYHIIRDEEFGKALHAEDPITELDILIRQCLLFYGTADVTMARGEGTAFMNIGKYLERGIQSSDILDVKFSTLSYDEDSDKSSDATYWKYFLLSMAGHQLYLKTYRSGFEARNIVEQIVLNSHFPRSVSYAISRMHIYFKRLKSEKNTENFNQINFMMGKLVSRVEYSTADAIMQQGLHQYLVETISQLNKIGAVLDEKFFAYSL